MIDYKGSFEIYRNGSLLEVIKNRVTDDYLDYLIKVLTGTIPPNLKIKYLAVGTGATDPGNNPTRLTNEIFRTQYTSAPVYQMVGTVRTEFVILAEEAIGTIRELGIFAGTGATGSPNSGILIAWIPWIYAKTGSDELVIVRNDTIRRA